jgi:hypothetical protein
MIPVPLVLEKKRYDAVTGMVGYRSKPHTTFERNCQLVPGARWLGLVEFAPIVGGPPAPDRH